MQVSVNIYKVYNITKTLNNNPPHSLYLPGTSSYCNGRIQERSGSLFNNLLVKSTTIIYRNKKFFLAMINNTA